MASNNGKPWWKSKMIAFNVFLGAGFEVASLLGQEGIISPEKLALIMGIGNILLRIITNKPVTLK